MNVLVLGNILKANVNSARAMSIKKSLVAKVFDSHEPDELWRLNDNVCRKRRCIKFGTWIRNMCDTDQAGFSTRTPVLMRNHRSNCAREGQEGRLRLYHHNVNGTSGVNEILPNQSDTILPIKI